MTERWCVRCHRDVALLSKRNTCGDCRNAQLAIRAHFNPRRYVSRYRSRTEVYVP